MTFEVARLDRYAERITTGLAYLGGLLILPMLFAYLSNIRWNGLLIPSTVAGLIWLFLLLAYAEQPRAYRIEEAHLVVQRRWLRALRIPLGDITGVSFAPGLSGVPHVGLRFALNPGVFGYQGPFYLRPYGKAFFLATNRELLVSLARVAPASREPLPPLIISPANPRAFAQALNEQRQKLRTSRGEQEVLAILDLPVNRRHAAIAEQLVDA